MSILSMTGFGRGLVKAGGAVAICDIRTVNNRFLDLNLRVPRRYMPLENRIREKLSSRLSRGRVDVFLTVEKISGDVSNLAVNTKIANKYHRQIRKLQTELKLKDEIKTSDLLSLEGVVSVLENVMDGESDWKLIEKAVQKALDALLTMRKKEGQALKMELMSLSKSLRAAVSSLQGEVPIAMAAIQERLKERLLNLAVTPGVEPERLAQEIALLLSRADVTEEIARLNAHLDQFDQAMKEGASVGKRLDFLLQEMNREITTYSNKLQGMNVSRLIVESKSLVEKLREQAQNVE